MCCGVIPILFGWFLRVSSLHVLVFIWKTFFVTLDIGMLQTWAFLHEPTRYAVAHKLEMINRGKHYRCLTLRLLHICGLMCLFHRYLDRIIRLSELEEFSALLTPHQKATTADGEGGTRSRGHCSYVRWKFCQCGLFTDHVHVSICLKQSW